MIEGLATGIAIAAIVPIVWTAVRLIRGKPMDDPIVWMAALLEIAVLVLSVSGIIGVVRTDRQLHVAIFVTYLVATPLVLPVAVLWGASEHSRAGTAVVLVGLVAIPALMARILVVWAGSA